MRNAATNFGRIALRGGLLTAAAQVLRVAIQLASTVILARLLAPTDFGLLAAAWPAIALVTLFQHLGLQEAVVQRKAISQQQLNQVFWMTALFGLICMLAIIALAPALAAFYGDERMTGITIAASPSLLFGSLTALPLSLLNRELRFGRLAVNDVAAALAGFLASVAAACAGFSYWSLILGTTVTAAVAMIAAWSAAPHRPGRPRFGMDADLLSFGANLTGFNLVNFFARNLDNILIGKFSGPLQLGYYDRAYKLLLFPIHNINQPLTRVMIPLLSRIQGDRPRVRSVYLRTAGLLGFVSIPGIAALAATAPETVHLLFGPRWMGVAPIFAWLGLAGIVQPLANTTGWLFISQGRTKEMFRLGSLSSLLTVAEFLCGLPWGSVGVAAAYGIGNVLFLPLRWWYIGRTCPVFFRDCMMLQLPYLLSAGATLLFVRYAVAARISSDPGRIAAAVVISYGFAALAVSATGQGRRTIREALSIVYRAVGRAGRTAVGV